MRFVTSGFALFALASVMVGGCASGEADELATDTETGTDDVRVDTSTAEARKQFDANVNFGANYVPRCARTSDRPRIVVTGFGRFMDISNNATGRIVAALSGAAYPETQPPPSGEVDPPEAQLVVTQTTIDLPKTGKVDVCAMILPVYWDLAAALVAKEIEAFDPSFVMMNGVAGSRQPLWLELGATNLASGLEDGSSRLRPVIAAGQSRAKLVAEAAQSEMTRGNLLSWRAVEKAAKEAVLAHTNDVDGGVRFGDLASGAVLAGYPRSSNTYLCNNTTYVTGYLMGHTGKRVRLLRASRDVRGARNWLDVRVNRDLRTVPRVFVHWPADLADRHHAAATDVMRAILDAQLTASRTGDAPTTGDNALADPSMIGEALP